MQKGFSLVELMIVISILGVLAAIAVPSYQNYVIRSKRAAMMSDLQAVASRIESKKMLYGSYQKIPAAELTNAIQAVSKDSSDIYTSAISPLGSDGKLTSNQWSVTATPQTAGVMAGDGNLVLHANGRKCRASRCGMGDEWRD